MKSLSFGRSLCGLAGLAVMAASLTVPLRAGQELELKDDAGKTIVKYMIEVPAGIAPAGTVDPTKQVGLIFCFQEHGTPLGNDLFPVRQSLWRQGLSDQYILLAGAPKTAKFGPEDHERIEKLYAWAKKTYPVNPRRVYSYGKGEGSKISIEFMVTHPNLITSTVTYSWGAWLFPSEINAPLDFANKAPEIYLTLGRRDLDNHLSCVRDAYPRLKAKGYHFIYREFDELGDRTYHPTSNDDGLAWATRLRNKNIAPSAAEMKLLDAFKGTPPAPVDGYYPKLALVGGAPAGAVIQKLLDSKDASVRLAAAETCNHAIFSEATTIALTKKVSDPSPQVRRAAIHALGMYADWRYKPAQDALIKLATDQNADGQDRLDATDALAYAVKLQVKGVRQDPPMFAALISLMSEKKEEPVRATAALTLAPIWEFDRTPVAPGTQRKRGPEGGWDKWLADITATEKGELKNYDVCAFGTAGQKTSGTQPVDLFCMGGAALMGYNPGGKIDPASGFKYTMQAAEQGYVPAESAVAMLFASGKGVQQDYAAAGKWWIKASEGGDLVAARHTWNLYRNGEGEARNATIANQWAKAHWRAGPAATRTAGN